MRSDQILYEKYVSNIKSYLNNENYDDYLLNLVERALGVEDQSDVCHSTNSCW